MAGVANGLRGRKIVTSEVAKILARLSNGEKGSVIAQEYGVSKVAIGAIRTGGRRIAAVPPLMARHVRPEVSLLRPTPNQR